MPFSGVHHLLPFDHLYRQRISLRAQTNHNLTTLLLVFYLYICELTPLKHSDNSSHGKLYLPTMALQYFQRGQPCEALDLEPILLASVLLA